MALAARSRQSASPGLVESSFPPAEGTTRDFALAYLAAGWSLLPVRPLDKRPLTELLPLDAEGRPSWKPYQTKRVDAAEIDRWLTAYPDLNLGAVTGAISGTAVLDIDGDAGVQALRASGQTPPPTLLQKTPHGWHAVYAINGGGQTVRNGAHLLEHVDARGEGGYIVVAPSKLADGVYRWHRRLALAPVPAWLERPELLQLPAPPTAQTATAGAPDWVSRALTQGVARGQRNATGTRLAGYFHSRRVPDDVIETLLAPYAQRCQPPLEARELQQIVRSVSRYAVQARDAGVDQPPTRLDTGDGYRYEWDGVGVQMEFRALHSERDGLNAELVVESGIPGTPRRVYGPVRFNLLAVTTRASLCNSLDKRVDNVDWQRLVDDASRLTVEGYRAGEPLTLLREAPEPTGDGWLLPPLVMDDGPTLWFAQGSSAKSWLALVAAVSISTGKDWGLGITPTGRRRVAYLDWEWEGWRHRRRLMSLMGAAEMKDCDILHRRCSGSLADQVNELRAVLVKEEVGFVVVDSVVPACDGEPEMSEPVRDFFDALRSLRVGSLLIAHNNKAGDEERPYGNVFWFNESRCIWYVGKMQEAGQHDLHVGLFNRKSNDGGLASPIGLHLEFTPDGICLARENIGTVEGLREKLTDYERVLAAISAGARLAKEVIEISGLPEPRVRTYLARAVERGQAVKTERQGDAGARWEAC